jgi:ferric-dicitrate binding protein FerR (iron transport regulator)
MPRTRRSTNYQAQLQEFIHAYKETVGDAPVTLREVAAWAIREGRWRPPTVSAIDLLAQELGQAAREDYMTDSQGRRVRRLHARKMEVTLPTGEMKQVTFWDDITTALPEHMHMAFQQRRRLILSDCHQLKMDVDSYNENWNRGEQLLLSYAFEEDLEELAMPTDYPGAEDDEAAGSDA